jgi:predicted CopG family antitoxin
MAVKTITIDLEAYNLLSRQKRDGQSFSDVIKAHFTPLPTAGRFRRLVQTVKLDRDTLEAVESVVRSRKRNPVRVVKL